MKTKQPMWKLKDPGWIALRIMVVHLYVEHRMTMKQIAEHIGVRTEDVSDIIYYEKNQNDS